MTMQWITWRLVSLLLLLIFTSIGADIAKSKGYDETLTNAEITGGGLVRLVSGRDTSILGGNITGNRVELDVGRNLTVVSPQALGYRKGFTAGLSIGFGPSGITSVGIRGSKERGDKAWTEPSSIVGVEGVDIHTAETTRLVGALIDATEGDVVIDTGRLELADLNDKDRYRKIGGGITIGIPAEGVPTADGLSFEYRNKQLEGVTRATIGEGEITIRDMDGDGIENEPEDIEQAETLIAAINRDPDLFREITRDTDIDISGDLNLKNLRELPGNIEAIRNYVRAVRAPVPADVAAGGPRAVDLYRKMIINGVSIDEAAALAKTGEFQGIVRALEKIDLVKQLTGSIESLSKNDLLALALAQGALFNPDGKILLASTAP